VTRKSRFKSR